MKNLNKLFLGLGLVALLGASSCVTECTCTTSIDGVSYGTTTVETEESCSSLESTSTYGGMTTKVTCN